MRIFILTLFPAAVEAYLAAGILGIARRKRLIDATLVNFRQYGRGRHRAVDDRPFGGGAGMVLKPEPVFDCIEQIEREHGVCRRILLCPGGTTFRQATAGQLASEERLLFLCGRYEGFDERIRQGLEWTEISLGDFVLCGGELAALAVIEATVRLLPGVLGDAASPAEESFSAWEPLSVEASGAAGRRMTQDPRTKADTNPTARNRELRTPTPPPPPTQLHPPTQRQPYDPPLARAAEPLPLEDPETGLEYPQYTRPRVYRDMEVPPVLLSGDHQAIRAWRRREARERTERSRPDLLLGRPKASAGQGESDEPSPPRGGGLPSPPRGGGPSSLPQGGAESLPPQGGAT
ncbi:MAG: tRNA (guanosine(37)-N1)-methyltransferase TrmD [Planctomycetes bacterium]|nr:tRNA (guanosine(37)-N1)-methyltransferase TrmD [Planctomycetota bacterium]